MNVIFVADELAGIGGIQRFVSTLGRELEKASHDVRYVSLHDAVGQDAGRTKAPLVALGLPAVDRSLRLLRGEPLARVQALLDDLEPGVLLLQSPSVVSWMRTVNTGTWGRVGQYHGPFRYARQRYHAEFIAHEYPELDASVFLTQEDADAFRRECGLDNAVALPVAFLDESERPAVDGRPRRVLALGRLSAEKGFDRLIRIFTRLDTRGWELVIVGNGPRRNDLRALARQARQAGAAVRLRPACPPWDTRLLYERAALLALPSRLEGFGLVVSEAATYGLPVVAFDVSPGVRQQVVERRTGFLVDEDDEDAFGARLQQLMSDDVVREELAAGAWRASRRYSARESREEWLRLLERLSPGHLR